MNQRFPALGRSWASPNIVTPLSLCEELSAAKPNPSSHPKLCLPVKKEEAEREVGLPEHDVTTLHSLEEGFDSAKPTHSPLPPRKLCLLVKTEFVYQE